jgi:membrane protein implicated in regulation of membrane protease activity
MSFFGVGRVPFMVVWVTFFIFAGFAGLTWNRIMATGGGYPAWAFFAALGIALVFGAIGVRLFSRLAARFVDVGGRGSARKHELCGKVGVVASATVDDKFGEIRVRDDRGNEMLVHGRLSVGEAPLKRGDKLVLVDFDADKELFWVAAVPELDKVSSH